MKRTIFAMGLAALLSAGAWAQDFSRHIGKPAPAFTLTTTDGKKLTNANLKGRAVLIDFWATWCGPCKAASPTMQNLHKTYGAKGLTVIGAIVMDGTPAEMKSKASKYRKDHKYSYAFATGADALATTMGVRGIPCFVFIDKKGIVRDVKVGFSPSASPKAFAAIVQGLLR